MKKELLTAEAALAAEKFKVADAQILINLAESEKGVLAAERDSVASRRDALEAVLRKVVESVRVHTCDVRDRVVFDFMSSEAFQFFMGCKVGKQMSVGFPRAIGQATLLGGFKDGFNP